MCSGVEAQQPPMIRAPSESQLRAGFAYRRVRIDQKLLAVIMSAPDSGDTGLSSTDEVTDKRRPPPPRPGAFWFVLYASLNL